MAELIKGERKDGVTEQVEDAFLLVLQRLAEPEEIEGFAGYVANHGLANACHLLLNANEFLYLD